MRYDNSSALSDSQQSQYLNFLKTGGNLFLIGENTVFMGRNDSILNLIDTAGGGQLDFVLPSSEQQVLSPFDAPNPIAGDISYLAPGGVSNVGTGQFITTDESNRGAGISFAPGSLSNAASGELTVFFDLNFLENVESDEATQNLLNNLTQLESKPALQSYAYDPVFSQVTSYTDELGRLTLNDIDPDNGNILSTTRVVGEVGGDDDLSVSYTYTDAGLVATMTDPEGKITNYDYDEYGRLIQETLAVGTVDEASIRYEYDDAGNQTAVIDENGNRTEYQYDELNRVIEVTEADPDGSGELTSPISTFAYDELGNLVETVDARNNSTQHEYDELNRRVLTTDSLDQETSYEYDDAGNIIATIDALGRRTEYSYDSRDRLTEIIDPLGNITKYRYDLNDNLIATIDPLGNTTRNFYDSRDRLFRTIDAESNITNYEYDGADNLIATVDGNENRTEYKYDELDREIGRIDASGNEFVTNYDQVSNVVSTTDEEGRTTQLDYDQRDRLIESTDAELGVASFEYDSVGNLLSVTDEENRTISFVYDALNRQTEIIDPLTHATQYSYDPVGNLASVADANLNTTSYTYDSLDRASVMTNDLGDTITTEYDRVGNVVAITDELDRVTTFDYDERDLQTGVTDPVGNTTTTEYDAVGNPIKEIDPLENETNYTYDDIYRLVATTDAEERTTNYTYDKFGNLLSITDPEQNTTAYVYDELNRTISDTNQLGLARTYDYDKVGNLIGTTDRNQRTINYSYDKLDRNTAEIWLDELGNPIHQFDYDYDRASQLTNAKDPVSSYDYDYDLAGRLTQVDNIATPGVPNVVFDYGYDDVGNLTSVSDTIDGVASGVENFAYDALNRVTSITQSGNGVADKRIDYTYDKASQRIKSDRASNLNGDDPLASTDYIYDQNGRLTDLTHSNDAGVIAAYDYTYDDDNRITEFASPEGVSIYNYDDTDQLSSADHDYQVNEEYTYDENGNRVGNGYDTGEDNRLLTDGTYNYEYDGEGNQTSQTEIATGIVTEYEWDYRNRLVEVVTKDSDGNVIETASYTYDVNDNRLAKSVDADGDGAGSAVVERYVHDGQEIALVFDGSGNQTERYFHGVGVDEVLAVEKTGGEVIWSLADHQGTVRVLLDNSGNVVNQISYDAFGNVTTQTNVGESIRFGYTGREFDSETGNYYYRARYYDPQTGSFISQDPIGFDGGDENLYRYVSNSPLNYTDPTGESLYSVLNTIDKGAAGFADTVTMGQSTKLRTRLYGEVASRNHSGAAFTTGRVLGGVTLLATGVAGPSSLANLGWAQKAALSLDVLHTGYGAYESTNRIMQGCADWTDALSFLPLLGHGLSKLKNLRQVRNLDEVGDAAKAAQNANLRGQSKLKDAAEAALTSCSTSFVAGTEVLTPDGLVNIEEIEVGDWVISDDPNTPGEITAKQVTRTFERTDNNGIYDVAIGERVISSTGNHDFWTSGEKLVSVDELQLGDWIIDDNPDTLNVLEAKQVLKSTLNDDGGYELQLDDEIVTVKDSEEFWIKDEKWVEASELEAGDLLQTEDGDFVAVDGIEVRDGSFEVFNFEVEDFHTYFVSQDGVLVHNVNCYTTTDTPVNLNRPAPGGNLDPVDYPGGTYVTRENITDPRTLNNHIRNNVPKSFATRGSRFYPEYVTEIDVPETALMPDIPGGASREGITAWIPPNTQDAKITKVWRVTEEIDPEWNSLVPELELIVDNTNTL